MLILVTLSVAAAGGLAALRLKVPAGALIGAMVAVAVLNIIMGQVALFPNAKVLTQTVAGAFIGLSMTRDTVRTLGTLVAPAIFVVVFMQLEGLLVGFLVYSVAPVDLATAMIASSPGGIVDMSLIAMEMGADSATVAVLHTVRLTTVLLVFPQVIGPLSLRFSGKEAPRHQEPEPTRKEILVKEVGRHTRLGQCWRRLCKSLPTAAVAAAGGLTGFLVGMPAGVLLFAMIFVATFNISTHKGFMPMPLRRAAQMLAGALVGASVGVEQILQMRTLVIPAVLIVVVYMCGNLLAGFLLHKLFKIDWVSGMFASSPAGASDFALIATELGAVGPTVAVLQIVRLISVIALFPQIVTLLIHLVG